MKKIIIDYNSPNMQNDFPRIVKMLDVIGYSVDKFPMEVYVVENNLDGDGVPMIIGEDCIDHTSQHWFKFEE